ncbi:hypothetical protein UNDYM_4111 [Undibacterium sp. YM2]|nr:hypothetical protein UNDYM_4111 [Undibacterium sp. YM2]
MRYIENLSEAVRQAREAYPFTIHAWVVLPDHLHCVIELPQGDTDFSVRWRMIKSNFSKTLPATEVISSSRSRRNERGIWQRRFWEHLIRDEQDFSAHMDYVHINPQKHGLVDKLVD